MVLFLGVCHALKAMHQYRVGRGSGGVQSRDKARRVRATAERADGDAQREVKSKAAAAARKDGRRRNDDGNRDEDTEQEPLMEGGGGEVSRAQEGVGEGELRAYAHRDVKPGSSSHTISFLQSIRYDFLNSL